MADTAPFRNRTAILVLPIAVAAFYLAFTGSFASIPEDDPQCASAKSVIQEAGQCLLYPYQRWERLDDMAGVRRQNCARRMSELANLGFYQDEAYHAAEWMRDHSADLPQYWQAALGRNFCTDLSRRLLPSTRGHSASLLTTH